MRKNDWMNTIMYHYTLRSFLKNPNNGILLHTTTYHFISFHQSKQRLNRWTIKYVINFFFLVWLDSLYMRTQSSIPFLLKYIFIKIWKTIQNLFLYLILCWIGSCCNTYKKSSPLMEKKLKTKYDKMPFFFCLKILVLS
jgi:hypothetical protein